MKSKQIETGKFERGQNLKFLDKSGHRVCASFLEGLKCAEEQKCVIASNRRISNVEWYKDEWSGIASLVKYVWAGTIFAHVEPGKTFRESSEKSTVLNGLFIISLDKLKRAWMFRVPEDHLDMRNALLLSEHPDYTIEIDGRYIIVAARKIDIVTGFPASAEQAYEEDPVHAIPQGKSCDPYGPQKNMWLYRSAGKKVGTILRCFERDTVRSMEMEMDPNENVHMLVETTEAPLKGSQMPSWFDEAMRFGRAPGW